MTALEHEFRRILAKLRESYDLAIQAIFTGSGHMLDLWQEFEDATSQTMMFADISHAADLRWKGLRDRLFVPSEFDLEDVIEANPWTWDHVSVTLPVIEERSRMVSEIERVHAESLSQKEEVPYHRLEMMYRNTLGEVINVSEQVELSRPEMHEAFPYSEYHTRDDSRVRRTHSLMQGFVAYRNSDEGRSILSVIRPKNGYNCRCFLLHRAWFEAVKNGWATKPGKPKWDVKWPNSASRHNFETGLFPDPGWQTEKFVA